MTRLRALLPTLPTRLPQLPLPRSLAGRIHALFSLTMLIFMGAGLGLFYRYQVLQHIEETRTPP